MKLTSSNVAAAAVIGAVLGWVVQPAFDETMPTPKPVLNCETAQCVPAAAHDYAPRAVPIIERIDEFDI